MHIVRFMGGLANQLFQLCLYDRLVEEYGLDNVQADISFYKTNNDHGGYKLNKWFSLNYCKAVPKGATIVSEENYYDIDRKDKKAYLYNGYWQDERFFPKKRKDFIAFFDHKFKAADNRTMYDRIRKTQSVSVHVRRGDYQDNYIHGNIANSCYIINAIRYIMGKVESPVFFIFSDDISWCEQNIQIKDAECYYVKGNNNMPELDLVMMSCCKHNIIANSSFSWWAQELNVNPDKIVISPEYWYNEGNMSDNLNKDSFVHVRNVPVYTERNEEPFFSILIPVYNKENCIRRTLAYACNQSYANIEIIITDDCSTDGTDVILNDYAKKDARIKILRNEQNSSLLASRIIAMKEAQGKYIILLDGDDYISTDTCMVLHDIITDNSVDVLEYAYIREPSKEIVKDDTVFDGDYLRKIIIREIPHTVWNKCYSLGLIDHFLNYAETTYCNMTEDVYFSVALMSLATSFYRIDDVLYHYVSGGMSECGELDSIKMQGVISSVRSRKTILESFLQKNNPTLLPLVEKGEKRDTKCIADNIMSAALSVSNKIQLLKQLDTAFNSDYSMQFEQHIEDVLDLYNDYDKGRRRHKLKMACRFMIETIKRMFYKA